ncbi:YfiM family lipoprotein [Buttiauxella izardii]|uniref:YfiM family lipoprotein n=1 Tax=Buttiauxella izardii TaxID=82991 RepID=A0A3A5JR63_9ENTR|nr:YfiM family lipoprotein [Buttiauxella izardii]RJT21442.1 YfiM family lipoprotein [Buttiauxella izardii]
MFRFLLPSVFLLSGCSHMAQDQWHGQDKAQHFIASAILSAAGNEYGHHQNWSDSRSANFGFLFSVSLGATKELWDSREAGSGWSWKDFTWDVAGAATGYAIWQLAN